MTEESADLQGRLAPVQKQMDEWEQAAEVLRIHEENDKLYGPL